MQDERVQHVAGKMCNMKKPNRESIQRDEKCSRERLQQDAKSETWEKMQDEKSVLWMSATWTKCNAKNLQNKKKTETGKVHVE